MDDPSTFEEGVELGSDRKQIPTLHGRVHDPIGDADCGEGHPQLDEGHIAPTHGINSLSPMQRGARKPLGDRHVHPLPFTHRSAPETDPNQADQYCMVVSAGL
ncbi:hypothetical protein ACFQVC_00890 [Streptomyces monticola]|uniref:Uncharacterized protein n=1 Tax=Streptomyces monticola TaxID=2666263 RepID=A0ABW2JBB2_9ACTN